MKPWIVSAVTAASILTIGGPARAQVFLDLSDKVTYVHIPYAGKANPNRYVIERVGYNKTALVTTDAAMKERWRATIPMPMRRTALISKVVTNTDGVVFIIADSVVFRSRDAGKTFERVELDKKDVRTGHHNHVGDIGVDGAGNLYTLHKYDSGRISVLRKGIPKPRYHDQVKEMPTLNAAMHVTRAGHILIYGQGPGNDYRTLASTDGGKTFSPLKLPDNSWLGGVSFDGAIVAGRRTGAMVASKIGAPFKKVKLRPRKPYMMIYYLNVSPAGVIYGWNDQMRMAYRKLSSGKPGFRTFKATPRFRGEVIVY